MIKDLQRLYNERGLIISDIQTLIDKLSVETNETIINVLGRQIDEKEIELHEVMKNIRTIENNITNSVN